SGGVRARRPEIHEPGVFFAALDNPYRRRHLTSVRSRDFSSRMWTEALSLLEQADRLHRQFLRAAGAEQPHAWEPPVDVIETSDEVRVQLALPGVFAYAIRVAVQP